MRLKLAGIALLVAGCASGIEVFPLAAPLPALAVSEVQLAASAPQGCVALAQVRVAATQPARGSYRLRETAASLGANLVVFVGDASKVVGVTRGPVVDVPLVQRAYQGVAYRC